MRIQGRYKARIWFRPWVFWLVMYPTFLLVHIIMAPFYAADDVRDAIDEWDSSKDDHP